MERAHREGKDVVFTFAGEMLEDAVAREFNWPTDQTLVALAHDDRIRWLLAADSWRSYPRSIVRGRSLRLVEPVPLAGRSIVRVRPHRLRRLDSTRPSALSRSYRSYARLLGKALAQVLKAPRATPASASLVTYNPFLAAYCDAPWISNVIYCGQDDWATGEGLEPWWDAYRDAYRRMDERGATIFAVSQELAARISVRAQVVPNGVNPDVWRPVHRAPPRVAELPRPRAVYSGTVDSRLHMDLVQRTARAVGSLITVGTYPDGSISDQLRSIDNVHMFDKVGQVELAATVQACDLGLIPHRNQAGIRAMSPIKLYEYLAGGLPVVSVDLPPVHGVDDERVAISPPEGWDDALTRALAMDRADESARQSFIDEVAWASRMQPVIDAAVA